MRDSSFNKCEIAPPINEGAKKTTLPKMTHAGTHPGRVKRPELGIAHHVFGCRNRPPDLAPHIASVANSVRLIGQDEARLIINHEEVETIWVGGVTTYDTVLT